MYAYEAGEGNIGKAKKHLGEAQMEGCCFSDTPERNLCLFSFGHNQRQQRQRNRRDPTPVAVHYIGLNTACAKLAVACGLLSIFGENSAVGGRPSQYRRRIFKKTKMETVHNDSNSTEDHGRRIVQFNYKPSGTEYWHSTRAKW